MKARGKSRRERWGAPTLPVLLLFTSAAESFTGAALFIPARSEAPDVGLAEGGREKKKKKRFNEREVCLGNHRRFVEWLKAPFVRKKPTSNWAFSDRREKEIRPPELHFC